MSTSTIKPYKSSKSLGIWVISCYVGSKRYFIILYSTMRTNINLNLLTICYRFLAIGFLGVSIFLGVTYTRLSTFNVKMSDVEALSNELKANPIDPNSFARADQAKVNHHHLSLSVDFDHQQLVGNVRLTVNKVSTNVSKLMLDTYELDIQKVQLINDQGQISGKLNHKLFPMVPEFGSKLEVDISSIKSVQFVIQVDYKTATTARALQWLKPEQTEGGVYPYMFSQCQAINARSMVPCQDTPSVKSTYTAEVID